MPATKFKNCAKSCCNPRREEDGSLIFWINGGEGFHGWFNEIEKDEG